MKLLVWLVRGKIETMQRVECWRRMGLIVLASLVLLSPLQASSAAQASGFGTVNFNNRIPGQLDLPVGFYALPGPGELVSAPYVAQLWASTNQDLRQFRSTGFPVTAPAPFGSGADAGYWEPIGDGVATITNVLAGDQVLIKIVVWDSSRAGSYQEAILAAAAAESRPARIQTGGAGSPPGLPAVLEPSGPSPGMGTWIAVRPPHVLIVDFRNQITGILNEPVFGLDGSRLAGANWVAQLYARDSGSSEFTASGSPAPFGTGEQAGYWDPGTNSARIVDIPVGCCAEVQVRVWDSNQGPTYEEAAGGPRAVSRTLWYFAGQERVVLRELGPISLAPRSAPGVVVRQSPYNPILIDVDQRTFLSGPEYVAQLFAAGSPAYTNFVALGSPAPVGSGTNAGHWTVGETQVFDLPFTPGDRVAATLRVWESSKGKTFAEALANGSLWGETFQPVSFTVDVPEAPPVVADFSNSAAYLQGRIKVVSVPVGLSFIGHPFARGFQTFLERLVPKGPEGTMIYVFNRDTQNYEVAAIDFGRWNAPMTTIPFGTGFFIMNPGPANLELHFEGVEGRPPPQALPEDWSVFITVAGTGLEPAFAGDLLGLPLVEGDTAYRFEQGQWSVSQFQDGGWTGFVPNLAPGEAIFMKLQPRR